MLIDDILDGFVPSPRPIELARIPAEHHELIRWSNTRVSEFAQKEAGKIRGLCDGAIVVRADDIVALSESADLGKMPCLRPPFPRMWIEWRVNGERRAVLIHAGSHGQYVNSVGHYVSDTEAQAWVLQFTVADGELVCIAASDEGRTRDIKALSDLRSKHIRHVAAVALTAICLMHCKNVTARAIDPDPKLQKARQKRGKRPLFRYHVLDIEPMKQVLRKEGGLGTGNGIAQALHICRGHFKDYRQSGLFGKVKGIFWWDQHARGDVKQGVVVKDYNVKACRG